MKKLLLCWPVLSIILGGCTCDSLTVSQKHQAPELFQVQIDEHVFHVELADTAASQQQGLSGRNSLPGDGGMLFVFDKPSIVKMWMKDCKIPLDVLFFDQKGQFINYHSMDVPGPNQPDRDLRVYASDKIAKYALELRAGTAEKLNLQPDSEIILSLNLLKLLH